MKLSKNSIYKLFILFIIFLPFPVLAENLVLQFGIYDFTDEVSKEFYKIAPSAIIATDVYKRTHLSFNVSSGATFTSVKYNGKRHTLLIIPLNLIALYTTTEPDTRIRPFFGAGFGLIFKFDKNPWFKRPYYSDTYGYIINTGLEFPLKNRLSFILDIKYKFFIPPSIEDLNVSGISSTIGLKIPIID